MRKPKPLKFNDTIGLIAPSSQTTDWENIEKAVDKLVELGFKVKRGKSLEERYGYLAGTDEIRAADINNMFKDEEVDGIICLRGGYGTPRILDLIDYDIIKNNPKVFVGYSDITALHIAFNQICDLVTIHGPMVSSDMIGTFHDFTKDSILNTIMGDEILGELKNPEGEEIISINGGVAEGEIIGGNLSLIAGTMGTPYEIDIKDKILFIEEIGEQPYSIDRMINQLRLAGKLEEAAGFIIGDFNNCVPKSGKHNESLTLEQIIMDHIKPFNKPTIMNFKAGHCAPMITVPFGINTRLDADNKKVIVLEKATE